MLQYKQAVQEYRSNIYNYAYYYLRSREEAEDVTQEVLIKLWNNWNSIDQSLLQPWLIRVTRNASIDALRKRKSYRARVVKDADDYTMLSATTPEPQPDKMTEGKDIRGRIEDALAQVKEPYRTVVILREIQDMKYEEISQALEIPLNTVKVYLHRGRHMMRNILRKATNNEIDQ
jgi:RNA polymerase sigma factor (sigma-70 family)